MKKVVDVMGKFVEGSTNDLFLNRFNFRKIIRMGWELYISINLFLYQYYKFEENSHL